MDNRFGPRLNETGTEFRLWAPSAAKVEVILKDGPAIVMQRSTDGFWLGFGTGIVAGARYKFGIAGHQFPDPASRQQDYDSDGWSVLVRPLTIATKPARTCAWHETIICEVHIGTASPEGTFAGLMRRLEHFHEAGYTALEIMPINEFPGDRNWGYDGTLICAPDSAYGTREDLRALIDRAHALGLPMILDVVYNHFGEIDNFLPLYAPEWFDAAIDTPWGKGIDFTQPMVRQFYYENACMWLTEFDFDGLRFDSVHEIQTDARTLFLRELSAHARAAKPGAKLIIENMDNCASWLQRGSDERPKTYTAQWNEDIHHVLDFLVTGEPRNGYDDRSKDPYANLEKALRDGFVYDGEAEGESSGNTSGEPGSELPPDAFVSYVQNHDQIGNRADGMRLPDRISAEKLDFLHFTMMLAPQIPLFFMGQEVNTCSPFPFFIDLDEADAAPKREDRYTQMREIFGEEIKDGSLPDPNAVATFQSGKLRWGEFANPQEIASLKRFRQLVGLRQQHVWPLLGSRCLAATTVRAGKAVAVDWVFEAGILSMALNASDTPMEIGVTIAATPASSGNYSQDGAMLRLGSWSVVVWSTRL